MVTILKTFISFILSLLSIFNLAGAFGNTGENAYDVKNEKEVLLDFAAISDIHMTDDFLRGFILECGLDDMDKAVNKPDALILAGDMTDDGYDSDYENLKKSFAPYNPAENIIMALGNHDTWTDDHVQEAAKANFIKYSKEISGRDITECYYSTEINGYTFIVMGSEGTSVDAYISPAQLQWLRAEMDKAAEKDLPIFVISHWPLAFTHGLPDRWTDEENPEPLEGSFGNQNAEVDAILKDYENVFLISGHIHNGLVNEERADIYGYTSVESYGSLHSINLPAYMFPTGSGNFMNGSGYSIEVYEDEVMIRARNFITGVWFTDYDVTIPLV